MVKLILRMFNKIMPLMMCIVFQLLPYNYTLKLEDDTIIVSVPASDIT